MNKLRLLLLALAVSLVSACGSITGPDADNTGVAGSGGQTRPVYNTGVAGSGG